MHNRERVSAGFRVKDLSKEKTSKRKVVFMSLKIDEYLSYNGVLSSAAVKGTSSTDTSSESTKAQDSYISTIGSADEALPCENYNDFAKVFEAAKSESDGSATYSEAGTSAEESGTASAAGGSGDSSESEDETTTEVVTINGVTYLQTTTVENGVTTVERKAIGTQGAQSGSDEN
ncbi:MAG: hypothetical protein LUE96_07505 [Lachnospiraceae bacterium]|nr:hypothetical protein [Lachnospiraceae bacterium]